MSSPHMQLVKWTFPAVALIIGLFWYKRRRIDRADPGGSAEFNRKDKSATSDSTKQAATGDLYDSDIRRMDEILSADCCIRQEEPARAPRKVSESLDIPIRKSTSQSFSMQSSGSSHAWCKDLESATCNTDVQLGSNPSTSNLEMIVKSRNTSSFDVDDNASKITRIIEDFVEESGRNPQHQTRSKSGQKNVSADECNCDERKQQVGERSESVMKAEEEQVPCERDSANHSPVSGVLGEGSVTDEARSEGSTDSGKGGSINGRRKDNIAPATYDFAIPQHLVGRLIGRYGSFLHNIRTKTAVDVFVNHHSSARDQKICSIQGSVEGITAALEMIRQKFPEKKFPEVTLVEIPTSKVTEEITWITELMQLSLVEGVNNDVTVCYIMKPNWLFVQLPTHPTYPSLRILDANMTHSYNTTEPPPVPNVLKKGMIFVAKWYDIWVRVCIEQPDPLGERNLVRMVDHGGFWTFSNSQMRKIRSDYLSLPFQAIEIFLANIQPKNGAWSQEAYSVVAQICSGVVGQAQIEGYIDSNIYVNLYFNVHKHGVISLADELIARGFAEPVPLENVTPEAAVPIS